MSKHLALMTVECWLIILTAYLQREMFWFPSSSLSEYLRINDTHPKFECSAYTNEEMWESKEFRVIMVAAELCGHLLGFGLVFGLSEKIGRRILLFWISCPVLVASAIFISASKFAHNSRPILFTGAFVNSTGRFMAVILVTLYLMECSPIQKRCLVGSMANVGATAGIAVLQSLILCEPLSGIWWASLPLLMTVFLLIGMAAGFYAPDSPKHSLLTKENVEDAYNAVIFYKSNRELASDVFHEIRIEEPVYECPTLNIKDFCASPTNTRPLKIGIALGIIFCISRAYMNSILGDSALHSLGLVGCKIFNVSVTYRWSGALISALSLTVIYNINRRPLLLIGTAVFIVLSWVYFLLDIGKIPVRALISGPLLLVTQTFYHCGPGNLPLVIICELSPQPIRSLVLCISFMIGTLLQCAIRIVIYQISLDIDSWIFILFSIFPLMAICYLLVTMPETRGRPLSDILANWTGRVNLELCSNIRGNMNQLIPLVGSLDRTNTSSMYNAL